MVNALKRLMCVGIAVMMVASFSVASSASAASTKDDEQTVDVTITSGDGESIVAELPRSKVQEYKNKLKDDNFRKSEIENSKSSEQTDNIIP